MATIHRAKSFRIFEHAAAAALISAVLSACPSGEDKADAGRRPRDAGGTRPDAETPEEDGSTAEEKDAATQDARVADAGIDAGDAGDAGPKDAGKVDAYVPVDPIKPGDDAPTLSKIGYFKDTDLGNRILIQGRDPNGDVAQYTIKFFNGTTPVAYDIDNDTDTPPVTEFSAPLAPTAMEAGFFLTFEPTLELVDAIDTIKVFVTDEGLRKSSELTAKRGATPVVTSTCDPYGFNRCNGTSVCARAGANNVCTPIVTARMSACTAALTLSPPAATKVQGELRGYSLWDIPASCGSDVTGQSDAVIKLKLASATAKVVLSTENDYTNFDTVLYLLDTGCRNAPATCAETSCLCSDDVPESSGMPRTVKSRLTLTNLAAGDHYIVVDSAPSSLMNEGRQFELSVTVE